MIRILELFGGIGACSKALERLGIDYEIADYVEIDKYAVKSFNAIHNTNFEPQDICEWDKDIEVDLIMHGSPCQDFSLAGKQAGGDKDSGTRSSLMYETIRIVEKLKPKYVIWENVKNLLSKKHRHNFDAYLETMEQLGYTNYYQVLNAKDYGIPQNRERVFTISILGNESYEFPKENIQECEVINPLQGISSKSWQFEQNVYSENSILRSLKAGGGSGNIPKVIEHFEFPPKQELKLKLKDMLEDEVDEKYYLSDKMIKYIIANNEKWTGNNDKSLINKNIASAINTGEGSRRCDASNYLSKELPNNYNLKIKNATKKGYLEATDGDGIDISARMKYHRGNVQKQIIQTLDTQCTKGVVVLGNYSPSGHEASRIVDNEGLAPTVKENHGTVNATQTSDLRIRKLTPKECWRLMGFDDADYERAAQVNSNTQLYKQAGNSIVVNVLEAILTNLLLETKQNTPKGQLSIYDYINASNSKLK